MLAVRWYLRFGLSYRDVGPQVLRASDRYDQGHPVEVVTDHARAYPGALEELLPAAWHRTDQYADNRVEADRGRLKLWLRPYVTASRTITPG